MQSGPNEFGYLEFQVHNVQLHIYHQIKKNLQFLKECPEDLGKTTVIRVLLRDMKVLLRENCPCMVITNNYWPEGQVTCDRLLNDWRSHLSPGKSKFHLLDGNKPLNDGLLDVLLRSILYSDAPSSSLLQMSINLGIIK